MTALFLGIHKTGEGYREVSVPVIYRIHGPDHERFSSFLRKQGELGVIIL